MSRPQLYHSRSGNSLRAAIAVELARIDVERCFLDLGKGEHKKPEFLAINPAGAVPAYVEVREADAPGAVLTQSGAILGYLLARHRPELVPGDPFDHAQAQSVVMGAVSDIAVQNALLRYLADHAESAAFLRARLLSAIAATFSALPDSGYFGGESPDIADFAQVPVIHMREALLRAQGGFGHALDWLDRMREIDAVSTAIGYAGLQLPDKS